MQSKMRTHAKVQPFLSVAPLEGNRIDSFMDTNPGQNINRDMSLNTNLLGTVEEESNTEIPGSSRHAPNKHPKLENKRINSVKGTNRSQTANEYTQNISVMETVYENHSAEPMLPPNQTTYFIANAPPLPNP